jgi:acetolactate synthase regulatory subunit
VVTSALGAYNPALKLVVNERYRVEVPDAFSPVTLEAVLRVLDRL